MMNEKINGAVRSDIPDEKFTLVRQEGHIHDQKLETKPIGYFKDAWLRFRKNKSSVIAAALIILLMLFALVVPFFSNYTVQFRDGYYKTVLPKIPFLAQMGLWDGTTRQTETQGGYDYYDAIGRETGEDALTQLYGERTDTNGITYYDIRVDSYAKVGFVFVNLNDAEYQALQKLLTFYRENTMARTYILEQGLSLKLK